MKKGFLLLVADVLSIITIVLCLVQKLPQIRDLYGYKSARGELWVRHAFELISNGVYSILTGISAMSLYLELFSYTSMMLYNYCYGYSLLSYMEYPVLLIQEYILILLVLKYQRQLNQRTFAYGGGYIVIVLLFAYQILPKFLLALLVVSESHAIDCDVVYWWMEFLYSHFAHQLEPPAKSSNWLKFFVRKIRRPSAWRHGFCRHSPIWVSSMPKFLFHSLLRKFVYFCSIDFA